MDQTLQEKQQSLYSNSYNWWNFASGQPSSSSTTNSMSRLMVRLWAHPSPPSLITCSWSPSKRRRSNQPLSGPSFGYSMSMTLLLFGSRWGRAPQVSHTPEPAIPQYPVHYGGWDCRQDPLPRCTCNPKWTPTLHLHVPQTDTHREVHSIQLSPPPKGPHRSDKMHAEPSPPSMQCRQ